MTTDKTFSERNRDSQDGVERHVFSTLRHTDSSGAVVDLIGSGTNELEVPVMNQGYGFNLDDDTNAEVFTLADGSDMHQKFAVMTLPRDKQRKWAKGTGGVQNPQDPDKALEFNAKRTHLTEENVAMTPGGLFEIKDGVLYIRCDVHIEKDLYVGGNLTCGGIVSAKLFSGPGRSGPSPTPPDVPGFEP